MMNQMNNTYTHSAHDKLNSWHFKQSLTPLISGPRTSSHIGKSRFQTFLFCGTLVNTAAGYCPLIGHWVIMWPEYWPLIGNWVIMWLNTDLSLVNTAAISKCPQTRRSDKNISEENNCFRVDNQQLKVDNWNWREDQIRRVITRNPNSLKI